MTSGSSDAPLARDYLDYVISIVNSRFVMVGNLGLLGELTPDLTNFVWWDNAMWAHIKARVSNDMLQLSVRGTDDHSPFPFGTFDKTANPRTIPFKVKTPTADDERAAERAKDNQVSNLTINASLSVRLALRRLLYIDEPLPRRKPMASQEFLDKYYAGGSHANRSTSREKTQ